MIGSLSAAMTVVLTMGQTGYVDGPSVAPVAVSEFGSFNSSGFGGELYPYDTHYPWVHGYFQEIPAYGGYVGFRPYNYKHVLSQSQAAGGWGLNPTMPYSQQFWHRYHQRASLQGNSQPSYSQPSYSQPSYSQPSYSQPSNNSPQETYYPTSYSQPPMAPPVPSYPQLFQR